MGYFKLDKYDYISSNRTNKNGSGVGIYITEEHIIQSDDLNRVIEDVIESVFIEINASTSKNNIIGTVYSPQTNSKF